MKKVFNFAWGSLTVQYNDGGDIELMIYETIGSDPWTGTGMTAKQFKEALDAVPRDGRTLSLLINSLGGDVFEAMAIKNMLEEFPSKIVAKVMGIAASAASWIMLAADEVQAYRASQVFIHDAIGFCFGNAADMEEMMGNLDKTSNQIAGMYAEKTSKGVKTMRQMMRDETLLTGEEAEELGLVDTIIDGKATRNFTPREIVSMSNKLAAMKNSVAGTGVGQQKNTKPVMNKKKLIAWLNKAGVTSWEGKTITEETSDEHLEAAQNSVLEKLPAHNNQPAATTAPAAARIDLATDQVIIDMRSEIKGLRELNNTARKTRYESTLVKYVEQSRIPANFQEKALTRAMSLPEKDGDEYMNELGMLAAKEPGADPLSRGPSIECTSEAFSDVQNHILDNGPRFTRRFIAGNTSAVEMDARVCKDIASRAKLVANAVKKHKNQLVAMWNANVIDANLQRVMILQEMIEEFAVRLLPLQAFSTVFNTVPLEGTDTIAVPFFDLEAGASTSWDPAVGYTFSATSEGVRLIPVGGSGVTSGANAAAGTAKDRKFQGMTFGSYEMRRQPYLNLVKLFVQKANKLGVDIFSDIVSRVITAANFGASVKAVAANAFAGDDIADLYGNATGRNWPETGRNLTLDHSYNVSLLKDPTFKQFLAYGSTDPLRKAKIQEVYGFENINVVPNLINYSPAGEFLEGFINWMYAVLVATSPIMPTPAVRQLLVQYDVVVHPSLNVAFEYRQWGAPQLDATQEAVECSYGAAKGVASGLARITSQ